MMIESSGLAALLAAHLVGDFVLQTDWIWARKKRPIGMLVHGLLHALVTAAALLPWIMDGQVAWMQATVVALAIAVAHVIVDVIKTHGPDTYGNSWWGFLADQALHVTVLAVVAHSWLPGLGGLEAWRRTYLVCAAVVAAGPGTMYLVPLVLRNHGPDKSQKPAFDTGNTSKADAAGGAGKRIGVLERWLTVLFVALGHYGAVAFILAAKSIARFEELKQKPFAEYYLVGTLTSFLSAALIGVLVAAAW